MRRIAATLVVGLTIMSLGLFGADSSIGTWKWNASKSKSITTTLKSRTDVYEATADGGVKLTRTEDRVDGTTTNNTATYKYDGKAYPVTGSPWDTISAKRVDANTTATEMKKTAAAYHQTSQNVISKDGKTMTSFIKGTTATGTPVDSTYVYDKQ
jgi:hypothetical protein